jgi:hypothetical protein
LALLRFSAGGDGGEGSAPAVSAGVPRRRLRSARPAPKMRPVPVTRTSVAWVGVWTVVVARRGNPPITHPAQLAAALSHTIVRAALSARSHTGRERPNAPRWPNCFRSGTVILFGGALVLAAAVAFGDSVSGRALALNAGGVASPASHPSSRRASARAKPPARSHPAGRRATRATGRAVLRSKWRRRLHDGCHTSPSHVWRKRWYTTVHFGNLRTGTGLLLDMGRPVQITNVRITLGTAADADLQVRIAASTTFEHAFRTVARAPPAAGLTISGPTPGRYVLIRFTRLPPTSNGDVTFQASIHALALYGLRA